MVPDAGLDLTCLAARTVPGQVRTLVELRLASWGLDALRDDVTLIASELVTNAVRHTPKQGIRMRLMREAGGVLLADRPARRRFRPPHLDTRRRVILTGVLRSAVGR
ncbi:hypothetical protein E1287_43130, partial [Actinomadura sp. KC06]